jgi:ribonuclease Z
MQLRKNRIRFSKINHIFISHLHGDHVFGLYGLLSTLSLMGRKSPLNLYAPENYGLILTGHLQDFDINLNYQINFIPLLKTDPAVILDDKYLTVTSFPLLHRVQSFGFLFREKAADRNVIKDCISKYSIPVVRIPAIKKGEDFITPHGEIIPNSDLTTDPPEPLSYAYCSDTKYFRRLPSFVKNVSLLYHEATFDQSLSELAQTTGHSTTLDAARVADEAGAGCLIIGHFSARYRSVTPLVEEARSIFPNTMAAIDGKTYDIKALLNPL